MNALDWIVRILVIIGALHIGILSFNDFNLIGILQLSWLVTLVNALIGLSGIWEIVKLFQK